jgi:hypothetical protein
MRSLMLTNREGERGFSAVEAFGLGRGARSHRSLRPSRCFKAATRWRAAPRFRGNSQQSARVAVDLITKDMRFVGLRGRHGRRATRSRLCRSVGRDLQRDLNPGTDNPFGTSPAFGHQSGTSSGWRSGRRRPLYAPASSFSTGAEDDSLHVGFEW